MSAHDNVAAPSDAVLGWMTEAAANLNRQIHSGGHWIVAWSHAGEPVLLWRDGNGAMRVAAELAVRAEALPDYAAERVVQFGARALTEMRTRLEAGAFARPVKKARVRR